MSDLPKVAVVQLDKTLRDTIKAAQAVHQGIATHAEKHTATRHARHAALEADRKLSGDK